MTERKIMYWAMLYLIVSIGDGIADGYILYLHPRISDTIGHSFMFRTPQDLMVFVVFLIGGTTGIAFHAIRKRFYELQKRM